jgi:hypothetical protein
MRPALPQLMKQGAKASDESEKKIALSQNNFTA